MDSSCGMYILAHYQNKTRHSNLFINSFHFFDDDLFYPYYITTQTLESVVNKELRLTENILNFPPPLKKTRLSNKYVKTFQRACWPRLGLCKIQAYHYMACVEYKLIMRNHISHMAL